MKISILYSGFLTVSLIFSFLIIENAEARFGVGNAKRLLEARELGKIKSVLSGRLSNESIRSSLEKASRENVVVGRQLLKISELVESGEIYQKVNLGNRESLDGAVNEAVSFLVNVREVRSVIPNSSSPPAHNVIRGASSDKGIMHHVSEMFSWPKENYTNAMNFLKGFNAAKKVNLREKDGGWVSAALREGYRSMREKMTGGEKTRVSAEELRRWKKEARERCRI